MRVAMSLMAEEKINKLEKKLYSSATANCRNGKIQFISIECVHI